tara:strand:- start:1601 stop:1888 length:288 start_codon:yes stop_codon:yes gene_type:complete
MKQREMIELVQQHHPGMGEVQIRKLLNRAQNDFCQRTDIIESSYVATINEGQRYYDIHPPGFTGKVLTINDVQVDDIKIPRFIGNPEVDDTTDES